jgi:hypothetical protein
MTHETRCGFSAVDIQADKMANRRFLVEEILYKKRNEECQSISGNGNKEYQPNNIENNSRKIIGHISTVDLVAGIADQA